MRATRNLAAESTEIKGTTDDRRTIVGFVINDDGSVTMGTELETIPEATASDYGDADVHSAASAAAATVTPEETLVMRGEPLPTTAPTPAKSGKQRRGFAAMDPTRQRAIASLGGKASHVQGTGHEWDSSAAREAGRKGGQASRGGRGKLVSGTGGA